MPVPQAETPMMRQFHAIKKEHPDKILFYRMGDFYEMFGEDAVISAKVLQIALTSRDRKRENSIPMCGIPYRAFEPYLNKMTAAGYKVAICEQMEDPAKVKGLVERQIVRVVTPGTTVSPQLIEADRNHYLLALLGSMRSRMLGAAFVDVSTGEFEVCEFRYEELSRFYDFVSLIQPREILLAQSRSEAETQFLEELTSRILQLVGIGSDGGANETTEQLFNFLDPYSFDFDSAEKRLKTHFRTLNLAGFGIDQMPHAVASAGALLHYLEETQKCSLVHLNAIRRHRFDESMLLDESSVVNLELFENQSGQRQHTLYAVLNRTLTPMGARLLRQWLRQPLLDLDQVNMRLDAIDAFRNQFMLCAEFRAVLKMIQDLPRIMGRISLPVAGIADLVALRESLHPLQKIPKFFKEFDTPLINQIASDFDSLEELEVFLEEQLLEEPSNRLREGGFIAVGVSEELDELRRISQNTKQFLNEMLVREKKRTGISSLKISFNKVFGYYMEVSNAHKDAVPEDYLRKQTLVNAERYITQELKEFEEKILTAEERIGELEYSLFLELKEKLMLQSQRVQKTASEIAVLDVLAGWADLAEHLNYKRPVLRPMNTERFMEFRACRHPVIEQIDLGEVFVPNDLLLEQQGNRIMLITGPNMAGKSTYMRQIALNVLMAQCGCFVPAEHAEFSMVDRIFTRVGASDNLSLGQSTFMMEMNEVSAILHNASQLSLIILDEVGRGTSTFDGISIAWAIVENLHSLCALTLCATHYHELTALSQELEGVENFSFLVEEEGEDIVFLRKLIEGEANKSYGVQVARLAGLPDAVVRRAGEMMIELEDHSVLSHMPAPPETSSGKGGQNHKDLKNDFTDELLERGRSYQRQKPADEFQQLSLFMEEPAYLEELRKLQINDMTPLEALNYLDQLKKKIQPSGN